MLDLEAIGERLARSDPKRIEDHDGQRAAVAMVLRAGEPGPEVLFIERARWEGDPWSGHMAFPGGRVDPGDADTRAAAERETLEEVGMCLAGAARIGRLDDKTGRHAAASNLVISAYVYEAVGATELTLNHEVESALWIPLATLMDPAHHVGYRMQQYDVEMPGILVGDPDRHVVWGLTYSFLESFFISVGVPLPDRWKPELTEFARGLSRSRRHP